MWIEIGKMCLKKKSSEYQSAYNNYAHGLYYCNMFSFLFIVNFNFDILASLTI